MIRANCPFIITWTDLLFVWRKYRHWMMVATIISTLACIAKVFLTPPCHTAKALFRESSGTGGLPTSAMSNLFISSLASMNPDGSGIIVMQSEQILRRVIQKLGLQVTVKKSGSLPNLLKRVYANALYFYGKEAVEEKLFSFSDVHYSGRQYLDFSLVFTDEDHFVLQDKKGALLAKAVLGERVMLPQVTFTLNKKPADVATGQICHVEIVPWENSVIDIRKKLEIRPEKIDKTLLKLFYTHSSRTLAQEVLNAIMDSYLQYLQGENDRVADKQLAFLDKRQEQFTEKFEKELNGYLTCLQQNVENHGFFQVEQGMEYLAVPQQELKGQLLELDSLFDRLKKVQTSYVQAKNNENLQEPFQTMPVALKDPSIKEEDYRSEQFAGIDLETAKKLHIDYQKELDAYQEKIDTFSFLLSRLHARDFDLDALGSVGVDTVTLDLIKSASDLALRSKDILNQSPKDLQRIEESLTTQKVFIHQHLSQSLELYKQNARLIQSKLARLRDVMLLLITSEKNVIYKKLGELQQQFGELPMRWKMEQQLEMKRDMVGKIIQGITQMIEGKTLESRLKQLNSKVIDSANCALKQKRPSFFFLLAVFVSTGLSLVYVFFFCYSLLRGFPLCESTARALEFATAGSLGTFCNSPLHELREHDARVLRALANFIQEKKKGNAGVVVALTGSQPLRFVHNIARFLNLRGTRVLIIDVAFDSAALANADSNKVLPDTLGAFLTEQSETWQPCKNQEFDILPCGMTGAFCVELLYKDRFSQLLAKVKTEYDAILLVGSGESNSVFMSPAFQKADGLIVTIHEETFEQIERMGFVERLRQPESSVLVFQETGIG